MEAARTTEMSVNFNVTTQHYIPEDPKLFNVFHCNTDEHHQNINCKTDPVISHVLQKQTESRTESIIIIFLDTISQE
jgi:hypothetical protein